MGRSKGIEISVGHLLKRAKSWSSVVGEMTVEAGFTTFALASRAVERLPARRLVIRLQDKRIFTMEDCCSECIGNSVTALLEMRTMLVDTQVELAEVADGQLFWILDWMLAVIRAFLTWEERARGADGVVRPPAEHYQSPERTQHSIKQLDEVRAHLRVALQALAHIAEVDLPPVQGGRLRDPSKLVAEAKFVLSKPKKSAAD